MLFSSNNFIIPNTGISNTLKIRDVNNNVVLILKEGRCTININGPVLIIKQNAESQPISLTFSTAAEAVLAHNLLRVAMQQLKDVQEQDGGTSETIATFMCPINMTPGINNTLTIPFQVTSITTMYVNGLYVVNNPVAYTFNLNTNALTWLNSAPYVLDQTDAITLSYF